MNPKIWHVTNFEGEKIKVLESEDYNYVFNASSGFFARWGKTKEEDPTWSPFGPEIMDIEISDGESCPMTCAFCSPSGTLVNTPNGKVAIETIKPSDFVIGYDVEKKSPKIQEVEEVYYRSYTGELVCIELDNGQVLKLTPEHGVFTKNRSWIMAKDLTEIDEILEF